jgi:hypothetical protein
LIGIALYGCSNRTKKVNWDPFYPNYEITKEEIISNGFEHVTADDGICVYRKEQVNKTFLFYLYFEDNCEIVQTQELYISLRRDTTYDPIKHEPLKFTLEDSLSIVSTLGEYKSELISGFDDITACTKEFQAKNEKGKTTKWIISLCGEYITLIVSEKINNGQVTSAKPSTSLLTHSIKAGRHSAG